MSAEDKETHHGYTTSHAGKYYQFHDVNLVPKPYQRPHPPLRVAVESRDTFALVGQLGFPIFIRHQMDIPELQMLLKGYQEERQAAGFAGPNDVILQIGEHADVNCSQGKPRLRQQVLSPIAIRFLQRNAPDFG